MIARQPSREELGPNANLCEYCTAKCCRYFALPIDTPTERNDYENIRWYMLHGRVSVFVDEGTWFLMIHNECDRLLEDGRCGIYEIRPEICREYSTDNCEYEGDGIYDQFFETPEQIAEYADAVCPLPLKKRLKALETLPIVS